jgi:hypothetical protein
MLDSRERITVIASVKGLERSKLALINFGVANPLSQIILIVSLFNLITSKKFANI